MRALTDGKTKIGAQLFPDRKRPAICVQKGNKIKIYGYFQSVEAAQEFMHEKWTKHSGVELAIIRANIKKRHR